MRKVSRGGLGEGRGVRARGQRVPMGGRDWQGVLRKCCSLMEFSPLSCFLKSLITQVDIIILFWLIIRRNRNGDHYGKQIPLYGLLFSNAPVSVERGSLQRPALNAASALFTVTSSWLKNLAGMISVRAARTSGFKKCCLRSGRYDGSLRDHYF